MPKPIFSECVTVVSAALLLAARATVCLCTTSLLVAAPTVLLPQVVEGNPCYEYVAYIVFPWFGKFEVTRNEKNGGNVSYTDLEQLKADYTSGALHPGGRFVLSREKGNAKQSTARHKRNNCNVCCDVVFYLPPAPQICIETGDLKPSLCKALNAILEPVRRHFVENKDAAALLKQVRSYKVTR